MKTLTLLALVSLALAPALRAQDGWISMFNGKDLTGWKSNETTEGKTGVFTVTDGKIKADGGRSHLFYVGSDGAAKFKNFEFKAKMMTTKGANSGIYIHTAFEEKGWPSKGYECQVNATHSDRKKTGGLYAVKDVLDNAPNKDDVWCDYSIKVEGKHIVIKIDDKVTVDWVEPEGWDPLKDIPNQKMPGRKLSEGTIALQGHPNDAKVSPTSITYFKDIFIKPLP